MLTARSEIFYHIWAQRNFLEMSHPLDFIVFGVPRSGTKALVHALNLHPHVYCAEERFHFRADHSRIIFPDSFLDASDGSDEELKKIKSISNELARKGEITHAGNKLPRYYFALHRINRELPAVKNIWISEPVRLHSVLEPSRGR